MRLTLLSLLLCSIIACDKDDNSDACAALVNDWTGTSWIEDNEQFFGESIYITRSDIQFDSRVEGVGNLTWHLDYTLGGPVTINGTYTLNENCDEVTITPVAGGVASTYHYDINGNVLTLEGDINNVQIEMKFERN